MRILSVSAAVLVSCVLGSRESMVSGYIEIMKTMRDDAFRVLERAVDDGALEVPPGINSYANELGGILNQWNVRLREQDYEEYQFDESLRLTAGGSLELQKLINEWLNLKFLYMAFYKPHFAFNKSAELSEAQINKALEMSDAFFTGEKYYMRKVSRPEEENLRKKTSDRLRSESVELYWIKRTKRAIERGLEPRKRASIASEESAADHDTK
ncbi:hypothetical protein C9890_0592 [Perkinsus sp. BL_2016]|nr:hypothetical protein C9890_0592 [Perkinsus sp. BL_2016]